MATVAQIREALMEEGNDIARQINELRGDTKTVQEILIENPIITGRVITLNRISLALYD